MLIKHLIKALKNVRPSSCIYQTYLRIMCDTHFVNVFLQIISNYYNYIFSNYFMWLFFQVSMKDSYVGQGHFKSTLRGIGQ